jgi:hypothetical protein
VTRLFTLSLLSLSIACQRAPSPRAAGSAPDAGATRSADTGQAAVGGSTGFAPDAALGPAAGSGGASKLPGQRDAGSSTADEDAGGGSSATGTPVGVVLAFPGAVGFGRHASGGRGGALYHVTTLADSGAGSFRDAVSRPHRNVVFDVGGYIQLQTAVSVASDLSIAGQTAPGGGIGVMAREVSFSGSSNVIVRNVRFRQGDADPDTKKSGINLLDTDTMIFDHVSIEFAQWNNIDSVRAKNITVQYSIDADPIGQHAWELKYGLDPKNAADGAADFDGSGYPNLEKYLDGLLDGSYP